MQMYSEAPYMLSFVDPYLYPTLQSVVGRQVAVQTATGSVRGVLRHVMPDHVVVQVHNTPFFIRTQQIVWVMPSS
ncbi:YuzF family protein [Brevibacillus sp. LEMMJ03]|uniref:YuzF family protein n=1 Tax=Brevibacillus sp. LEMMJ03 TaxID=2595056 RepID=UPI00351B7A1E